MTQGWEHTAEHLLRSGKGQQLLKNQDAIGRIAGSEDGRSVKAMMEGSKDVTAAMESGDMQALGRAISGILKTEEGARLAAELGNLIRQGT